MGHIHPINDSPRRQDDLGGGVRRPVAKMILVVVCAWLLPQTGQAQSSQTQDSKAIAPSEWPQTALIEHKGTPSPDRDTFATGMPVADPRQSKMDVLRYSLDLNVDPIGGWLSGKVIMIFEVVGHSLDQVVLDFNNEMVCFAATLVSPYPSDLRFQRGNDLLVIDMPTTLERDDIGYLEITFWGQPRTEGLFGYRVGQTDVGRPAVATVSEPWSARSWWPCKDYPNDKATIFMKITAPNGMTAVSNGDFNGHDGEAWFWREPLPIPTYLVSLAVSEYAEIRSQYDGPAGPIDLRHYVFPEDEAAAREDVSILPEMLDFCGNLFGPYPFADQPFGIVECIWDQAMEHPTAVTYGDKLITGTHQYDTVLIHELAHMWFGNMVTPTDWTHVWLSEGFATYVEALWAEHVYGDAGLRNFMASHDWGHGYGTDTLVRDPSNENPWYYFEPIAYHKGAWVLHMLRRWLGDEVFFAVLLQYLNEEGLRFGNAQSDDFQRICEEVSGQDLAWFFDQWLYRTTYPILRLDWQNNWQEGANELRIRVRQEQDPEPDGRQPAYQVPIELKMIASGFDTTVTVIAFQRDQEFVIPLGATVNDVLVDPQGWLLHDLVNTERSFPVNVAQAPVSLLRAYPNPFNPRTVFHWEAGIATHDLVEVFDVQGRRVLSDDLGVQPAGPREYLWLGRDASGRQHPSGTYLYRITCRGVADGREFSRQLQGKVTLAR